jgi:hypothetical protein
MTTPTIPDDPAEGMWELPEGFGGPSRHTIWPWWQVVATWGAAGRRRFELHNTRMRTVGDLGDVAASAGLYVALDLAHAFIVTIEEEPSAGTMWSAPASSMWARCRSPTCGCRRQRSKTEKGGKG